MDDITVKSDELPFTPAIFSKESNLNNEKINQELFVGFDNEFELTEEKVINRMNAENQYRSMKQDAIEKNPDVSKSIEKMERNVKAQQKNKSNNLSM